ncbi:MAG: hypothetical protein AAF747_08370 [Planctomycetota bacterium]
MSNAHTVIAILGTAATVASAQINVVVPATANIFSATTGNPGPNATAAVEIAIPSGPGNQFVAVDVTGLVTALEGILPFTNADGMFINPAGQAVDTNIVPSNGLSGTFLPAGLSLVGTFLGPQRGPGLISPSSVDFGVLGVDFVTISPEIQQTFFIGDGLTGNGTGLVQLFAVPEGATSLFLGFADGSFFDGPAGAFGDNAGQLDVDVSFVPTPASAALLGLGGVFAASRRR